MNKLCYCCLTKAGQEKRKREKNLFLRLNNEQNQLAWFEMRCYLHRKGVVIFAALELHIGLMILVTIIFVGATIWSIFFGIDITEQQGSKQSYIENAAFLGNTYIVVICVVYVARFLWRLVLFFCVLCCVLFCVLCCVLFCVCVCVTKAKG